METVLPHLQTFSYPGLFVLLVACSFGFPCSKMLLLLAAGVLASQGVGSLHAFALIGTAGLVAADGAYFFLGYAGGERVLRWRIFSRHRFLGALREAEWRHSRQGWWAVFAARFTPVVRTVVFLAAGLGRMPPLRFFLADLLSALIYAPGLCLCGYLFAENRHELVRFVRRGEGLLVLFLVVVAACALLAWFGWKRFRRWGKGRESGG